MLINENIDNKQVHNHLVSLIKQYNQIPNSHTNKKYDLYRNILNRVKQLGYNLTNAKGDLVVLNNDKPIRTIANRADVEEINSHKLLSDYPSDFQMFVKELIKNGSLTLHNIEANANLSVAQKDILNGKKSVSANNALDSLEGMFERGIIRIKASKHTPAISIPINEYFEIFENNYIDDSDDFWNAFFSKLNENKNNVKLVNLDVNNLTTLILERIDYKKGLESMAIRKRDAGFFSEKYLEWNNGGYKTPTEKSVTEFLQNNYEELSKDEEFKHQLLKKLNKNMENKNNNLENLIESIVRPLLEGKSGDYMKAIKKADRELEYELNGPGWKAKDKAHKDKTKYDRKRDKKTSIDEDVEIMDEATYSFDSEDPNLQQKTDKLKNDATLFNKEKDEIKINTESKKIVLTKNQIMEMNQLRQLNKKNVFTKNQIIEMLKKKDDLIFEDVSPNDLILFHGTNVEHQFDDSGEIYGGTFFSISRDEASSYGKYIYQITLKSNLNIFDTNDINDCQKLIDEFEFLVDSYYEPDEPEYYIRTAEELQDNPYSWLPIEQTEGVLDWLTRYDGVWIYEGGIRNLLLFTPVKEKIEKIELVRK